MILVVNAGSSSLKLALFSRTLERVRSARLEARTGDVAAFVGSDRLDAVAHRVVHGGDEHALVTDHLLDRLRAATPLDPEHMPAEIELIESLRARFPNAMHLACFDTAFHRTMTDAARTLPLPRGLGLRRYGFHGLSYAWIASQIPTGRIVAAHLGSGASLCAIRDGRSVDTTMATTPNSGIPMSTRCGDLDPGIVLYLARGGMSIDRIDEMLSKESGLRGISGKSGDVRDLEDDDLAIAVFCAAVKKQIGAYAAALGGIDGLVFSGGIGENQPRIRARICSGLEFLEIEIDEKRNEANEDIISSGRVPIRIVRANEELVIAREALQRIS